MTLVVNQAMIFAPKAITKTRLVFLASFLFVSSLIAGCNPGAEPREAVKISGPTMGTSYHITLVADEGEHFEFDRAELQKTIDDELETINQLMSTYIDDSELMRFNDAPIDQWMELSEPLMGGQDLADRVGHGRTARLEQPIFDAI